MFLNQDDSITEWVEIRASPFHHPWVSHPYSASFFSQANRRNVNYLKNNLTFCYRCRIFAGLAVLTLVRLSYVRGVPPGGGYSIERSWLFQYRTTRNLTAEGAR